MSFRLRRYHSRFAPTRSPRSTGCLLVILAVAAAYLLFAFTDLKALAGQAFPQYAGTPAAAVGDPHLLPSDPEDGPTRQTATPAQIDPTAAARSTHSAPALGGTPTQPAPTLPAALRPSHSVPVSDLLFLSEKALMLWDRRTHQARSLAENVLDFALAVDSATPRVLLVRPSAADSQGRPRVNLDFLDLDTGQETSLLAGTLQPDLLDLAAPGDRLAYVQTDGPARVHILETQPDGSARTAGICQTAAKDLDPTLPAGAAAQTPVPPPCTSLAWSPDGTMLAWSDARGLWLLEPGATRPRLAHDNHVQVADPEGQTSLYAASLQDIRWSGDGRFILLRAVPHTAIASWDVIIDVRTGYLASLTDTFAANPDDARAAWYGDLAVIVAHAGDPLRQTAPFIHFWHVFATNPELIVPGEQYDLYSDDFPFSPDSSKAIPAHSLDWLSAVPAEKVLFAVKLPATGVRPVLFSLDTTTARLTRLETLPLDVLQVLWSPDGSGALVSSAGGQFHFVSLAGPGLFDLEAVIPPDAAHPVWLAPAMPRKTPR